MKRRPAVSHKPLAKAGDSAIASFISVERIHSAVTVVSAITSAVRGTPASTAISPITLPRPRMSTTVSMMEIFTLPRVMRIIPSPRSPCSMIMSPDW